MKTCAVCGREFDVLYPELWRFKSGDLARTKWFCSWKCLRASETKKKEAGKGSEETMKESGRRDRGEVIRGLISAVQEGKDPVEYLKETGYADPAQTLQDLRKWAEERSPELYAQMPPKLKTGRKPRKKEAQKVELVYDPSIAEEYRREQAGKVQEQITVPFEQLGSAKDLKLKPGGNYRLIMEETEKRKDITCRVEMEPMEVYAVRSRVLRDAFFRVNRTNSAMVLEGPSMQQEYLALMAGNWKKLAAEIMLALEQLGIRDEDPEECTGNNGPL